jgi:hypothetical protein
MRLGFLWLRTWSIFITWTCILILLHQVRLKSFLLFFSFGLLSKFFNLLYLSSFFSLFGSHSSISSISIQILSIFNLSSWIWNIHHREGVCQFKTLVNINSFIRFNSVLNFINLLSSNVELYHLRIILTVETIINRTWNVQDKVSGCFIVLNICWAYNMKLFINFS